MSHKHVRWAALVVTIGLLIYVGFGGRIAALFRHAPNTCEERCLARDEACAPLARPQGGWPAADDPDATAKCNGLCYVLRARGGAADKACLQ